MHERLKKKINLLTTLTCFDHHKSRDGVYEVTYYYNAWSEEGYWYINHPGYLWDTDKCMGKYASYGEACDAMEKACDKQFLKEVEWYRDYKEYPEQFSYNGVPEFGDLSRLEPVITTYRALMETH